MKEAIKESYIIEIKYFKSENAYRIWGTIENTNRGFCLPQLSSEVKGIPEGVKMVAEGLLGLVKQNNELPN